MVQLVADLAALDIRESAPGPLVSLTRLHASYAEARREGDRAWNRAVQTLSAAGEITGDVLADLVMVRQARAPELADAVSHAASVLVRAVDEAVTAEHVTALIDALRERRGPLVERVCTTLETLGWAGTGPAASPNPTEPRKAVQ